MANRYARQADKDHADANALKLRVSFEYLDLSLPHFFFHGLEAEHYRKIFDCINTVANATESEIVQQRHPSLESKSIFNTTTGTYKRFPESIEDAIAQKIKVPPADIAKLSGPALKAALETSLRYAREEAKKIVGTAFEVRISKAYGRIHGIVWDKVFYVVWFDPAHNLYPDRNGIRLHGAFAEVKSFSPESVMALKDAHETHCAELTAKCHELEQELDSFLAK